MKILSRKIAGFIFLLSVIFNTTIALADTPFNQTVEGNSNYIVTGESYATNIQLAGYDSRNNKFYTNLTAETTKTIAVGGVATFNYEINVFDGTSTTLGNLGSYETPQTIVAAADSTTVQANNKIVTLSSPLTAQFSTVVTIDSTTIAP
ncbi:hypothetical protein LGK95_08960 [Clostridium algoriphilum]|uniref:hypothetical protein n=1 Tax=Clostridium algoriphilum TaxID=198347 RepID=UPI001CF5C542|nr:hypothetical protein [Clostridium algoriphilum]MCB2293652.1 hypothetical protein [Clostridium algoriphilum]